MEYLVIISTLFVIGSLVGYILEVLYRRIFSAKKWINPGFLVGPYIPIYGFGVIILSAFSSIDFTSCGLPQWAADLIIVVLIGVSLTLIELIAGLIFIKGLHIKLWDYSDRWGNFKGIICPLFSLIWFAVGCLYYFLLNPALVKAIEWISTNTIYAYFIGAVIGAMVVDTCYSLSVGIKLKKAAGDIVVKYEQFKIDIKKKYNRKGLFGSLVSKSKSDNQLSNIIKEHYDKLPRPKKWWKKKDDDKQIE